MTASRPAMATGCQRTRGRPRRVGAVDAGQGVGRLGQAEGVDDGHHPVGQQDGVEDEDGEQGRRARERGQRAPGGSLALMSRPPPSATSRMSGAAKARRTAIEADVGLPEAGEEKRQEGGREGRSVPALVTGALLHRAG